ncbi:PucR family transcriptional regulator [Nocardia sp. CWNU-33]|uniref:PucR family transcriptional regulator n=1 Tax=Nocardia sp. CWNU-33 TaxID=3392117 RepID=UPI00398EE92C
MSLVLREVLAHPAFEDASPRLVSGHDQLDHIVRWIHSADLYDIAPLLRGDEVLLTNGVGLLNLDESAQRTYVRRLAECSIAALFFEVGRTFVDVPEAMVDEARKRGLPLVVLQPVLRFTEVAEAINSEVIDRSVVRLRHSDEISRMLSEELVRGARVSELVQHIADAVKGWAMLSDSSDQVIASTNAGDGQLDHQKPSAEVPIMIEGTAWGRLRVGSVAVSGVVVEAVLDRAPRVLELGLIREQPGVAAAFRGRQLLLEQLAKGTLPSSARLEDGLRGAGIPTSAREYCCVVLDPANIDNANHVANSIGRRYGDVIFGIVDRMLCVLVASRTGKHGKTLARVISEQLRAELHGISRPSAAVSGTIRTMDQLIRAMSDTRMNLSIATALGLAVPVVGNHSTAVERTLVQDCNPDALRRLVDEVLGPLISRDREGLLSTLRVYVETAGSKAVTARLLHLRRQSLYYRLQRIEELIDLELSDPAEFGVLTVAFAAHRALGLIGQ